MGSVDDDSVSTSIHESLHTIEGVEGDTNTRSNTQTTLLILTCHRLILRLGDVLIGDKTDEVVVLVDNRQFLNLVLLQYLCRRSEVSLLVSGDKVILRHYLLHRAV